jgi:hypothetical protein
MELIIRLFVGHIIGDFILQSSQLAKSKLVNYKYLMKHVALVFISLAACTIDFWSCTLFLTLAVIAMIHSIDYIKYYFPDSLWLFIFDQIIHLGSLVIVPIIFGILDGKMVWAVISRLYSNIDIWIYFAGYSFGVFAGKVIVGEICKKTFCKLKAASSSASACIGIIERLIIITLALFNQYTAIGVIFAIKGAARKAFLDDKEYPEQGEYYFIGTSISFLIAIISALAIKGLLDIIHN